MKTMAILAFVGSVMGAQAFVVLNSSCNQLIEPDTYATDADITLTDLDNTENPVATLTFGGTASPLTNDKYLDQWNTGDWIDVAVSVAAGDYEFSVLYVAGSYNGAREIHLQTDAALAGTFVTVATWKMFAGDFVDTGNWNTGPSVASTTKTVTLAGGNYNLRYLSPNEPGVQTDGFTIVAVPGPATLGFITAFGGGILFIGRRFLI